MAVRCKEWVCSRSPAGIAGSNPLGSMNAYYLWMLCLLLGRGLCDGSIACPVESYRVWCFWVWSRNIQDEPDIPSKSPIKPVKIELRSFRTTCISLIFDEYYSILLYSDYHKYCKWLDQFFSVLGFKVYEKNTSIIWYVKPKLVIFLRKYPYTACV